MNQARPQTPNQGYGQGYGQQPQGGGFGQMFGRRRRSLNLRDLIPNFVKQMDSLMDNLENTICQSCENVVNRMQGDVTNEQTLSQIGNLLRESCDVMPCINKTECYIVAKHYPAALKDFASNMFNARDTCETFRLCGPNSRVGISGGSDFPGFGLEAFLPVQEPAEEESVTFNLNGRTKRQVPGMGQQSPYGQFPGMQGQGMQGQGMQGQQGQGMQGTNLLDFASMLDRLLTSFGVQIPGLGMLGRRMQMLKTGMSAMSAMGGMGGMPRMGGGMPGFGRKKRATEDSMDEERQRFTRQVPQSQFNPFQGQQQRQGMQGGQSSVLDFIPMLDQLLKSFGITIPGLDMLGRRQQQFKGMGQMGQMGRMNGMRGGMGQMGGMGGMPGFGRKRRDTGLNEQNLNHQSDEQQRQKRQMMNPPYNPYQQFPQQPQQQFPQRPQQPQQPQEKPSWFNVPAMLDSILKRFGINIPGLKSLLGGKQQQQQQQPQQQYPGMGGGMGGMPGMGGMGSYGRKKRATTPFDTQVEPEHSEEMARCIGSAMTNETWKCQLCKRGMTAMSHVLDIQMSHESSGLQNMCRLLPGNLRTMCQSELLPVRQRGGQGSPSAIGNPVEACQGLGYCLNERLP
eukprot:XP_011681866.1 PREDICTED: glutenin, high molecular weight subunit PW212 [Strongylocentrotus purpuratus]